VLIRYARPGDLPPIRVLEQQTRSAAHWSQREYEALFAPESAERVALVVTDDASPFQIHGFVIARCGPDEWEIENVVVAGAQRRRGLASALLRKLLHEASQKGATSALLEVREHSLPARKLYEKLGFSEVGRRKNYYQDPSEDALLLKISISFP
jgi:ribosomal-protein-alanine acetyltransferase